MHTFLIPAVIMHDKMHQGGDQNQNCLLLTQNYLHNTSIFRTVTAPLFSNMVAHGHRH